MRLIDADALIEAHYQHCNIHHNDAFYSWSLELMLKAPTIDVVPAVRKHCDPEDSDNINGKIIIGYEGREYTFRLHIPIEEDLSIMANKAVLPIREIYLPMTAYSRWERKDDDKSCDTCKHHDKGWDDIVCDGCTKAHSNWERRDDE